MLALDHIRARLPRVRGWWLYPALAAAVLALSWWLRHFPASRDPLIYQQLQFTSGILALMFAAAALIRFRVTGDRLPLVLACGFVIVGLALAGPTFVISRTLAPVSALAFEDPGTWVISRTLLAVFLLAALVVEQRLPRAREPVREIVVVLVLAVVSTAIFTSAVWPHPADLWFPPSAIFPRPGNLLAAVLFLLATYQYEIRLAGSTLPSDYALYYASMLNVACSLAASQSAHTLDAAFVLAGILQFCSYAVLLGGALLDNIRLFENVHRLSVSDPLTNLANYRHLVGELENEIQRSDRTGRQFALLLLDLDGLKKINDRQGHLVGSRALCRVASILLQNSRSIDICARYGGDEFAVILPETSAKEAQRVAARIRARVAEDPEWPPLSISAGIAIYPNDGERIESLFHAADRALYSVKGRTIPKLEPGSPN